MRQRLTVSGRTVLIERRLTLHWLHGLCGCGLPSLRLHVRLNIGLHVRLNTGLHVRLSIGLHTGLNVRLYIRLHTWLNGRLCCCL